MSRFARAFGVFGLVFVAACGSSSKSTQSSTTTVPTPSTPAASSITNDQLSAAALAAKDLGPGWSSQPLTPASGGVCSKGLLTDNAPPSATAEVEFVKGTDLPVVDEQLLAYPNASAASQALDVQTSNAHACTSYSSSGTTLQVAPLTPPSLGDAQLGYVLTTSGGAIANGFYQKGPVIVHVTYASDTTDTSPLTTYSKVAYDKAVAQLHTSST